MSERPRRLHVPPKYLKDYEVEPSLTQTEPRSSTSSSTPTSPAPTTVSEPAAKKPKIVRTAAAPENQTPSTALLSYSPKSEEGVVEKPAVEEPAAEPETDQIEEGDIETYPPVKGSQTFKDSDGKVFTEQELKDLIKQLYVSKNFSGAFSGIGTIKRELYLTRKIHAPDRLISEAVCENPVYAMHVLSRHKFRTQNYNVNSFGELLQADLGHMFKFQGYNYFLLVQGRYIYRARCKNDLIFKPIFPDVFSLKMWTFKLKDKPAENTTACFTKLLQEEPGLKIRELQCDKGTEFEAKLFQDFLDKEHIRFSERTGQHKASKRQLNYSRSLSQPLSLFSGYAESSIGQLKRLLFKQLRQGKLQKLRF